MSTTTSPQSGHEGFRNKSPFDVYLPSSPDDEQLTKVNAYHGDESSHNSLHPGAAGAGNQAPMSSTSTPGQSNAFHPDESPYTANGFTSSSSYGSPDNYDFEPDPLGSLLLESNFGPLPAPDGSGDQQVFSSSQQRSPTTASRTGTNQSRMSSGLANHSSQLMSPVLTEVASPVDSGDFGAMRHGDGKLLGGGEMSRDLSSASTARGTGAYGPHTPAASGGSTNASPGGLQVMMPSLKVEMHSRGDSPARTDELHQGSGKRSRGGDPGSHLAAPNDYSEEEDDIEDDSRNQSAQRGGLGPKQRTELKDAELPSLEDQKRSEELDAKNRQVASWQLNVNDAPALLSDPNQLKPDIRKGNRRRAKSSSAMGDRIPAPAGFGASLHPQAAGIFKDEESEGDMYSDDDSIGTSVGPAPPSTDGRHMDEEQSFPIEESNPIAPEAAHPWIDPVRFRSHEGTVGQPETSEMAVQRFLRRAKDIDTASRVATWGTQRRMSDGDLQKVLGSGGLFSRLSISKGADREEWKHFKESIDKATSKIIRRSPSTSKRKPSESSKSPSKDSPSPEHSRKDSSNSLSKRKESLQGGSLLKRIPSVNRRQKSPKANMSGTALAVVTQIGSLGVGGQASPGGVVASPGAFDKPGLGNSIETDPVRRADRYSAAVSPSPIPATATTDASPGGLAAGIELKTAPKKKSDISPTLEGFRLQVSKENPQLDVFLHERLAIEQLRRYKKLVGFKVEHAKAKELNNCGSGEFCVDRGGQPKYLNKAVPSKDANDPDEDDEITAEGLLNDAHFNNNGLPMPPVKRLPAKFECPLCFQVKEFLKPSDWSKHVHEDLQPFTCTFPNCTEPKSFKRKADWVRHENERHRQLEWWQCSEDGCQHICYRRDNFVQHLVREHRLPEPKTRAGKAHKPQTRGPAKGKRIQKGTIDPNSVPLEEKVLVLVENCRQDTTKSPLEEPCRFCGIRSSTWKKLTVHLAKHMEMLSIPVLDLVEEKEISADTIISPIEAKVANVGISPAMMGNGGFDSQPYDPQQQAGVADSIGFSMMSTAGQFPAQYQTDWGNVGGGHQDAYGAGAGGANNQWMPQQGGGGGVAYAGGNDAMHFATQAQLHQQTHHHSLPTTSLYAPNRSPQQNQPQYGGGPQQQRQQQQGGYVGMGAGGAGGERPDFHIPQYGEHQIVTSQGMGYGSVAAGMGGYSQPQPEPGMYDTRDGQQQQQQGGQQPFYGF